MITPYIHPASYKDPDGFVFSKGKTIYRQINQSYKSTYEQCDRSGLFNLLWKKEFLIIHSMTSLKAILPDGWRIIKPTHVPYISYPYEWSFSMLKDAALLTLKLQSIALDHNMSMKDASAYNIQFINGKPICIDTLSFENLEKTNPWTAYRQFCMHFLSPLVLSSYVDIRLLHLLREYLDGIPLGLTSKLLPKKTWLNPLVATHIHMHAKNDATSNTKYFMRKEKLNGQYSLNAHKGLVDSLTSLVASISWKLPPSRWGYYDEMSSYSITSYEHKQRIIEQLLSKLKPPTLWDLGGNTGTFSRIASRYARTVCSFDIDPVAVERNYIDCKRKNETTILPLLLDLTNPSPDLGWNTTERSSWKSRGPCHTMLVLALMHHLTITYNLPFSSIALLLSQLCSYTIIEFVPKTDPQTISLLQLRKDIFSWYSEEFFVQKFLKYFRIIKRIPIKGSKRVIYLLKSKKI